MYEDEQKEEEEEEEEGAHHILSVLLPTNTTGDQDRLFLHSKLYN